MVTALNLKALTRGGNQTIHGTKVDFDIIPSWQAGFAQEQAADYANLIAEGYARHVIIHACVSMLASSAALPPFVVKNADGELVLGNAPGHRLQDSPTIPDDVPFDKIGISTDGQVTASREDGTIETLGQLQLARFPNASGLIQYGDNIFIASAASGDPIEGTAGQNGIGLLRGSMLELSNTSAVGELVELIKTQRVFQMNSQIIQSADETLQVVANLRR